MVVALHIVGACRPEVPPRFVEHSALAQDAAIRGDHLEAARQWQMASEFADLEHVRDEAIYRQATSLERAGKHDAATTILEQLAAAPGSRQERAAYDLATRALLANPSDNGKQLEMTLTKFPGSGVARGAMDRWLRRMPPEQRLTVLNRLATNIDEPSLSERIHFQQARTLCELERPKEALERYDALVTRYPYPAGQYWDEALLHKASLQATLGDRRAAIKTLQKMLAYRETATIVGTYERRYAIATLMLARFTAQDDWRGAHALLQDFPAAHPTSRELDDALWAAALLARDNGDTAVACGDMDLLRANDPSSRYATCRAVVCAEPHADVTAGSACRDYVGRNRSSFEVVIKRAAAPYYSGMDEQDGALERQ